MKQFKLILRRSKVLRTRPPLLPSKNKIKQPGLSPSNQRHLSWTPWQRVLSTALSNSLSGPLENQVSNNNDMLHTKLNKRNKWLIWSTFNQPTRPITIERHNYFHMQLSFPKQKQKATSKWNIIIIKKIAATSCVILQLKLQFQTTYDGQDQFFDRTYSQYRYILMNRKSNYK